MNSQYDYARMLSWLEQKGKTDFGDHFHFAQEDFAGANVFLDAIRRGGFVCGLLVSGRLRCAVVVEKSASLAAPIIAMALLWNWRVW